MIDDSQKHSYVATSFNNLALAYESLGEYNQTKNLKKMH